MNYLLGVIVNIDLFFQEIILDWRHPLIDNAFFIITQFGNWQVIIFLSLFAFVLFYLLKRKDLILLLLTIILGTGLMTTIVKLLVNRSRPNEDVALYLEKLPSFPSAHAALSFAFFGFLTLCLWRSNRPVWSKIILSIACVVIVLLIGLSRVYLGVHFFSDIIGGYLIGLLWIITMGYLFRKLDDNWS